MKPMMDKVEALSNILVAKVDKLKLQDKGRGLFTFAVNNSKDTVVFPTAFSGKAGEKIYRFRKDFAEAIIANQVREADKVKTLRRYLAGEAKQKIGDHYQDGNVALTALVEYFGNPKLTWKDTRDTYERAVSNFVKNRGVLGSQERIMLIARTLEFLRKASSLSEEFK